MGKKSECFAYNDNLTVNDAGSEKVTKTFDKKEDALDYAKEIAKSAI